MILTKRQKQILDYLRDFIAKNGYAPSLVEIGRHFNLRSISTIHKHLVHLESKGLIRRRWNRARAIEVVPLRRQPVARDLPLVGLVSGGQTIEPLRANEVVAVPEELTGRREAFALKVKGESLLDEQIRDGDYLIVENRTSARNGETVLAVLEGQGATLGKLFREKGDIRLQPAHSGAPPRVVKEKDLKIKGVVVGLMRKY